MTTMIHLVPEAFYRFMELHAIEAVSSLGVYVALLYAWFAWRIARTGLGGAR